MKVRAIFDNGGETFDRYTIIFNNGEMIGASDNPFHPMGFGQHVGNVVDNYMNVSYGASWRRHFDVPKITKKVLKDQIKVFKNEGNIGKQITMSGLPEDVIKFIDYAKN